MSKVNIKILIYILSTAFLIASVSHSVFAHKLSVFAWIDGDTVVVEGKLSGGKRPKRGMVYVYDGKERLLLKIEINPDGIARFPLPDHKTGLKILMDVGEGHKSYWILTPYDIKCQLKEATEKE